MQHGVILSVGKEEVTTESIHLDATWRTSVNVSYDIT